MSRKPIFGRSPSNNKYLQFSTSCLRFNYGIVIKSDTEEKAQRELLDLCTVSFVFKIKRGDFFAEALLMLLVTSKWVYFQIACEKFAPSEKTPKDRDNQAAAAMIKVRESKLQKTLNNACFSLWTKMGPFVT